MSQKPSLAHDSTLVKWLLKKEIPVVDMRLATEQEVEREAKMLSNAASFLGAKTEAFYIREKNTVVLTPNLKTENFGRIISIIDHEMLHHVLTTFISGKVSHQMDNLIDSAIEQVGLGNLFTIRFYGKLDLEVENEKV